MAVTVVTRILMQVVEQLLWALVELEATEEAQPTPAEHQGMEVQANLQEPMASLAQEHLAAQATEKEVFFPHRIQHTAQVDKEVIRPTTLKLQQEAPHITASLSSLSNPRNPSAGA